MLISAIANISRGARILIAGAIVYVILLCYLAATSDDQEFKNIFSETGFFEQASIIGWIAAAFLVIVRALQPRSLDKGSYLAHSLLFVLCAMREADWHKKFTCDGILKISYYLRSAASLWEKVPAALVATSFIALIIHALVRGVGYLRLRNRLRNESTWIMIAGISLFFMGKILDRSISLLTESLGFVIQPWVKRIIGAQEEGLEMITPMLIAVAFLWPTQDSKHHKHSP